MQPLIRVVFSIFQDVIEYRKKQRILRVRMLDGSVKTLQVDDSHTVAQLMITICFRIGKAMSMDINQLPHNVVSFNEFLLFPVALKPECHWRLKSTRGTCG